MKLLQYERIIPANYFYEYISEHFREYSWVSKKKLCWVFFSLLETGNGDRPFDVSGRRGEKKEGRKEGRTDGRKKEGRKGERRLRR